jgi:hypothetical protein
MQPRPSPVLQKLKKFGQNCAQLSVLANGTAVALDFRKDQILFVVRDQFEHWGDQSMNVRKAFSPDNGTTLNLRSRIGRSQRRTSTTSRRKTWFRHADATPDVELRSVVAQRFMSMNAAHDRIRTELLASRPAEPR